MPGKYHGRRSLVGTVHGVARVGRGIRKASELHKRFDTVSGNFQNDDGGNSNWRQTGLGNPDMNGGKAFIVGVRSAGPDRKWDTEDDISTWPDEVD